MGNSAPVTNRIGRMLIGEDTDPRAPQTAFLVPAVALLFLLVGFTPDRVTHPLFLTGGALVVLATLATFTVPWSRLPTLALVSIPLLDLAGIGFLRLNVEVGAVAALVVFPAMWLGTVFRWRGVVIVTLASIVALTIPGFAYFGTSLEGWSRAVLLPIVAFAAAKSTCVTAEAWANQRAQLEEQGEQLEHALDEVTEQRRLAEAVMEAADVGLLAIGADGTYDSMNPRHREFVRLKNPHGHDGTAGQAGYAYAADKVTLLSPDKMPSVRAARGESFSNCTIWVGKEPAERRALSVSSRPMLAEDGSFNGAVLAYKDVTDLIRALWIKDDFVASVSHELRTPLTSILGYLDLTHDYAHELPREVNQHLHVVGRNAERLLVLVSDLLTTSQAEEGTMRLSKESADLADVVRLSVASFEPRAASAQVRVTTDLARLPLACVDPGRFAQVVDNLLSNSIKYTPADGTVHIALERDGEEVLLTVTDNGIGISAHEQAHVFTKFFRAGNARERAIPGVGLGLVISKAMVDGHGGTIDVESVEGAGTTVRVRLPLGAAEPAVPGHTEAADVRQTGHGPSVLTVAD